MPGHQSIIDDFWGPHRRASSLGLIKEIPRTVYAVGMAEQKISTPSLGSWKKIVLFTTAAILVNWMVGASGFFLYQTYRSSISEGEEDSYEEVGEGADFWAEKIASGDGAFILFFRHAEREKWPLVSVYDYFEVSESIDGRQETYAEAVCLSERGAEDARVVGRVFRAAGIPVAKVLSSPSCRARETAILAFGRIDEVDRAILHPTAVASSQTELFADGLLDVLERNSPQNGERVVIVGHGGTLDVHSTTIFPGFREEWRVVNESGFYLIEVTDSELILRWAFPDFNDFAQPLLIY